MCSEYAQTCTSVEKGIRSMRCEIDSYPKIGSFHCMFVLFSIDENWVIMFCCYVGYCEEYFVMEILV